MNKALEYHLLVDSPSLKKNRNGIDTLGKALEIHFHLIGMTALLGMD